MNSQIRRIVLASILSSSPLAAAQAAKVQLISVLYGANARDAQDFTHVSITRCRTTDVCEINCANWAFADTAPGKYKLCFIRYSCGNGPPLERTLLESTKETLDCKGG